MKRSAIVIADNPVFERWLLDADRDLDIIPVAAGDAETLIERIESEPRVDIVFCEFTTADAMARASFVEQYHERHLHVPVVALGTQDDSNCVMAAMRAGARDFFVVGRDDATVLAQVNRLLRRSAASAPVASAASKAGKLMVCLSGHPHESIAFFAEHLALGIVEMLPKGERVLLIDLATPSGAAAIFLNISQTYSVLDAINDAHRCDQTLIDTAFNHHSSGLFVLSLPEDLLGRASYDVDQLLKLLQVLRGLFAYTVLAVDGHSPIDAIAGAVQMADHTLLLSDQSILKSRHNKYLLRALRNRDCPMERTALVVDNYRRRLGLEPRNLAELFELPLVASLQTESYNRIISMNSGEPLYTLARKDPYCAGMRKLAETMMSGEIKVAEQPQSFFDRLLS